VPREGEKKESRELLEYQECQGMQQKVFTRRLTSSSEWKRKKKKTTN